MTLKNGFGKCYLFYQPMDEKIKHGLFVGPTFSSFNATPAKITEKKILELFFRDEICLISSSSLYKSILCMVKRTN